MKATTVAFLRVTELKKNSKLELSYHLDEEEDVSSVS